MQLVKKLFSFLLCAVFFLSLSVSAFAASSPEPFELTLLIDGSDDTTVRAYQESYAGNLYLSLLDLSRALDGTAGQFRLEYGYSAENGESFTVRKGQSPAPEAPGITRLHIAPSPGVNHLHLSRNRFYVEEQERKYYTYRSTDRDLYMSLLDVQLMLDISASYVSDSCIRLSPGTGFSVPMEELITQGYFDAFDSILLADADTGKALYSSAPNRIVPIASLSKLMSYLLLAEAMEEGRLHSEDIITISQRAATLSLSADGIVFLSPGAEVPAQELLEAMLLASSNESALALAEATAGTEEDFVRQMNDRAAALGLRTACFYSPHGLPVYNDSTLPAKLQNRMSASDLFRLVRMILSHYPDITQITCKQYCKMEKLDYNTANSNPLVFNLEGVNGLKTGSTNKAGYCLAATMPVRSGDETHTVVLLLLGAESADVRGQAAELLLRYARDYYEKNGF